MFLRDTEPLESIAKRLQSPKPAPGGRPRPQAKPAPTPRATPTATSRWC